MSGSRWTDSYCTSMNCVLLLQHKHVIDIFATKINQETKCFLRVLLAAHVFMLLQTYLIGEFYEGCKLLHPAVQITETRRLLKTESIKHIYCNRDLACSKGQDMS